MNHHAASCCCSVSANWSGRRPRAAAVTARRAGGTRFHWQTAAGVMPFASATRLTAPLRDRASARIGLRMHKAKQGLV